MTSFIFLEVAASHSHSGQMIRRLFKVRPLCHSGPTVLYIAAVYYSLAYYWRL